jgi:hypothetical protein
MHTRYCSLGDQRSWTELVTNHTSLSGVDLDRDLKSMLGWGSTPKALLPALMHEATHHWCFLSPVGFVLAHLQLRARRRAVLLRNDPDRNLLSQLLGDVIRYETTAIMLRPLAEGLALFAEFDAVSGPGVSASSLPNTLVALFFGDAARVADTHRLEEWSALPLREWRNEDSCARRKESVLGHPFGFTEGGYLPGYLAVRRLWGAAAQNYHALLNRSDLFLTFLRSFFYNDPALVNLLLDESPPSREVAEGIITHIAGRFDQVQRVTKEQVDKFERAVAIGPEGREAADESDLMSIFTSDNSLLESTRRAISDLLDQVENPDQDTVDGLLAASVDKQVLLQRDIIHLGSQEVDVSIDDHGGCVVRADGKVVQVGPSLPGVQAGTAQGRLDLIFSILPGRMARGSMIYRGDDLVAVSIKALDGEGDEAAKIEQRFGSIPLDPAGLRAACEEMQGQLDIVLSWQPLDKLVAEMRTLANDLCASVYEILALRVPPDRRSDLVERMSEDGLLPLLHWDRDTIYGLVLISISWSLRLRRPQIVQKLADYGLDLDSVLQAIADIEQECHISIVTDAGDVLFSEV